MTDCAKKHIIFLAAWFLCMGFVLLMNFSWIALGILVVLTVISLYEKALCSENKLAKYLTVNVRYYIIASAFFIECVYIIVHWNGFGLETIKNGLFLQNALTKIGNCFQRNSLLVILIGVLSVLLSIIRKKMEKHPFIHTLLSYQFPILVYSYLWLALYSNPEFNLVYIVYSIVYMIGDLARELYDEDRVLGDKAGKRFFSLLNFILLVVSILNPQIAKQFEHFKFNTVINLNSRWSIFLFSFIVSLVVLVSTSLIETNSKKGYAYEKSLLLTTTSILPVIFVCNNICVSYRWVLLILYVVLILILVTRIAPRATNDKYKYSISDYFPIPLVSLAWIYLLIEAQNGKLLIAVALLFSTWILVLKFRRFKNVEDRLKKISKEISAVIIWLYVNTLSRLWMFHYHYSALIVLSAITIVFLLVIRIINYNPKIYQENTLLTIGQYVIPVLFVVIALVTFSCGGSDIDIAVKENYIYVEIEADGKDNVISEVKYCWYDRVSDIVVSIVDDTTTNYQTLSINEKINARNGLLKIVAEDKYGVKTIKQFWCSNNG